MAKGTRRDPLIFTTLDEAIAAVKAQGSFAWVRVGNVLYRVFPEDGKVFNMGLING